MNGTFGWAEPDEDVHRFVNDLERPVGTYLYGRRMYETMAGWETDPSLAEASPVMRDFAEIWHAADKIVYSRTASEVSTGRTRIEREFDAEAVRELKRTAERDLAIGGPELAANASGPASSTRFTSSWLPSSSGEESAPSPTVSAWT